MHYKYIARYNPYFDYEGQKQRQLVAAYCDLTDLIGDTYPTRLNFCEILIVAQWILYNSSFDWKISILSRPTIKDCPQGSSNWPITYPLDHDTLTLTVSQLCKHLHLPSDTSEYLIVRIVTNKINQLILYPDICKKQPARFEGTCMKEYNLKHASREEIRRSKISGVTSQLRDFLMKYLSKNQESAVGDLTQRKILELCLWSIKNNNFDWPLPFLYDLYTNPISSQKERRLHVRNLLRCLKSQLGLTSNKNTEETLKATLRRLQPLSPRDMAYSSAP